MAVGFIEQKESRILICFVYLCLFYDFKYENYVFDTVREKRSVSLIFQTDPKMYSTGS